MNCFVRVLQRLFQPAPSQFLAYIIFLATFISGTFFIYIHHVSRSENLFRGITYVLKPSVFSDVGDVPNYDDSAIHSNEQHSVKSIVWLNPPLWMTQRISFCRSGSKCNISYDSRDIPTADAVVVHGYQLKNISVPKRRPNQIYVYFVLEPPVYVYVAPEWRYAFNWTISYSRDSDIWRPYGDLRPINRKFSKGYFQNIVKKKKKAVAWIVSRCRSQGRREEYVKELRKYIPVDIYGRCGTNKCRENCSSILETYRFYLAFENSICRDYVTEKFFKTFDNNIVPVVRGGANYSSLYSDGVLINTADFHSIKALGTYLNYLMKNDEEYAQILENRRKYHVVFPVPWCSLCDRLHNVTKYPKTYDIYEWLDQGKCREPKDIIK